MSDSPNPPAPPTDLDVPAARRAARLLHAALARGVPRQEAWDEAVSVFAGHHPSWPMPLVEREALRLLGPHPEPEATHATKPTRPLPLDVLVDLSTPETPETMRAAMRAESLGAGRPTPFRGAWRIAPPSARPRAPFLGAHLAAPPASLAART